MSVGLKLSILSPERKVVEGLEVSSVTLRTCEGDIQILPGHADLISTLDTGVFKYTGTSDGAGDLGVISSGFVEVKNGQVSVMAETVELKSMIDANRAKKAQSKAEQELSGSNLDEHQFKKYQLKLQRAMIRQQVASQ
jgi:F-type H+-transporting ATPase subunit epsilon